MRALLVVLALAFCAASLPAPAQSGPMSAITQFISALNAGNSDRALAACASPASILDEFAPHEWQGRSACSDWLNAFAAHDKGLGITDEHVTLHTPQHVMTTGDRAYIVIPADYSYKQRGRLMLESGSILTVALKNESGGWRITGWAWSQGRLK